MCQRRITPTKYAIRKPSLPQSPDEKHASQLRLAAQLIEQLRAAGLECEMSDEMPARKM